MAILVDDTCAIMDRKDFDDLPDYSCSLPGGTIIGKRWKRSKEYVLNPSGWLMGEYIADPHGRDSHIGIIWREIIEVVEPPKGSLKKSRKRKKSN